MAAHVLDLAPFWLRLLGGAVAAASLWLVAVDLGQAIVTRVWSPPSFVRLGIAAATGYAAIGMIVAVLGLIGEINRFTMLGGLACALAARGAHYVRCAATVRNHLEDARAWLRGRTIADRIALAVIAFAVLTGMVNAALPAAWWDPIAYHLPIVASALRHGSFVFDPYMVQTGFPALGEAAALPAYAIAGSAGAAMTTLGAGIFAGLIVWALAEGMALGSGVLAATLVVSSALWAWLAPAFYVDIPFALFVLAAILIVISPAHGAAPAGEIQTVAACGLAGALCGAAASVKYSGLGGAIVVAALVLWTSRAPRRKAIAAFALGCGAVAAAWYLRAWLAAGDPFYPFLSASLGHTRAIRDFAVRYVDMTRHWCGSGTSATDLVLLPYRLLVQPRSFCGDPGAALQLAAVFAVAAVFLNRGARVMALVVCALTLIWFATSQQWRFLAPALFLYSAIAAAGVWSMPQRLRSRSGFVLSVLAGYVVATNWVPALRAQASASVVPALAYVRGSQPAQEYLDERLESFAAARWLHEFGVSGDQVVALDDVRDYYLPEDTVWANPYYQQATAIDWTASAKNRYAPLVAAGKTYLVVNGNEAYVRRTPTGVDWAVLAADRKAGLRELFTSSGVTIYDMSSVR